MGCVVGHSFVTVRESDLSSFDNTLRLLLKHGAVIVGSPFAGTHGDKDTFYCSLDCSCVATDLGTIQFGSYEDRHEAIRESVDSALSKVPILRPDNWDKEFKKLNERITDVCDAWYINFDVELGELCRSHMNNSTSTSARERIIERIEARTVNSIYVPDPTIRKLRSHIGL